MKDYYVCLPGEFSEGRTPDCLTELLCGFSDNEFIFTQYIIHTCPILKRILDVDCQLTLLKYSVDNSDQLFDIVRKECGCKLDMNSNIVSVSSVNNPEFTLYMTSNMYIEGNGICIEPTMMMDTFLCMLWSSVELYDIAESLIKLPDEVHLMMQLIRDKYRPIICALYYTDMHAWLNKDLLEMVNSSLPDHYKYEMNIYDVVDDAILWSTYGDWDIDCDDREDGE